MKYLIVLLGFLPLAFCQTSTTSALPSSQEIVAKLRATLTVLWKTADTNHDGNWTKADIGSLFTTYDTNHDGTITRVEFTTVWNKDVPELRVIGRGLFYDLDTNFDGVVKDEDLDAYVARVDADNNGTVTEAEFVDYFTRLFDILYKIATIQVPASG